MDTDPFAVRWEYAGDCRFHAHDADGTGCYFLERPEPDAVSGIWAVPDADGNSGYAYEAFGDRRNMTDLDWRASLRAREAG